MLSHHIWGLIPYLLGNGKTRLGLQDPSEGPQNQNPGFWGQISGNPGFSGFLTILAGGGKSWNLYRVVLKAPLLDIGTMRGHVWIVRPLTRDQWIATADPLSEGMGHDERPYWSGKTALFSCLNVIWSIRKWGYV